MRKHLIHVLKFPNGRFLAQGFDCADQFVTDPLSATPMTIYSTERDTNEYQKQGAVLIQYEVTTTLAATGLTCADNFKDERERIATYHEEQRAAKAEAARVKAAEADEYNRNVARTLGIEEFSPSSRDGGA